MDAKHPGIWASDQRIRWRKLEAQYTTAAEAEFFKQLEKALKTRGTLDVLRHGIKLIPGIRFSLCFFKPASGLNAALVGNYEANILSVNREIPADIEITEDMLRLQAFRVEQKEQGAATLGPGDTEALTPISEFAAKPYTEEEERSLSEIIKTFNDRHGTTFTREDFIRFEQVNREIMDDDLTEMLRNNPPDVVFSAFSEAFFKGAIRMFQRDNEMKSIVLSDTEARDRATRHFFNRALREVREGAQG